MSRVEMASEDKTTRLSEHRTGLSEHRTNLSEQRTGLSEHRTNLSTKRTVIAAERTLMAWIRTSISMIGFGFTIYKFFQYVPEDIAAGNVRRPDAPRNLGLALVALGTVALTAAAFQHRKFLKDIGASDARNGWSISFLVAIAVVFIGLLAFFGILLRRGPF
jgi:putative membrane protein